MLILPKLNRFTATVIALCVCVFAATPALSDQYEPGMDSEPVPIDDARQLLLDTAATDDLAERDAARVALGDAQRDLEEAVAREADPAEIEAFTEERDTAQLALDQQRDETQAAYDAVAAMTDQQVQDTNRSLNNARKNGTIVDLDAATLQDIADRDLERRDIQSVTKALEEEAKFGRVAARFDRKYEESGREQFLRNRDRALDKGEMQREKFERKAGVRDGTRDEIRTELRSESRDEAKKSARVGAMNEAKNEAKNQAKAEAKRVARDTAREEAKRSGKANGRGRN